MADITQLTTHIADGLAHLLEQFKGQPKMEAFLTPLLSQVQELEVAVFGMLQGRRVATAVGAQLDVIGSIVDETRNGRSDVDYRAGILAKIQQNQSGGRIEDVLAAISALIPTQLLEIVQNPLTPAQFYLNIVTAYDPFTEVLMEDLLKVLLAVKAAGVEVALFWSFVAESNTFTFATGTTPQGSTVLGYADETQTDGGFYRGVIHE